MDITCPSGLAGTIQKFNMGTLDEVLRKMKTASVGMHTILARTCWAATMDRGPYAFDGPVPPWDREVLTGDRFYTVLQARILTRGPNFSFDVQCDGPKCNHHFGWMIDLTQLPEKKLSDEARQTVASGNRFERTLSTGRKIVFSLPTGTSQKRLDDLVREHGDGNTIIYAARLHEVSGVEKRDILKWALAADIIVEFEEIEDVMNEADCGVETEVITTCPECGYRQTTEVGFGRGFFFKDRKRPSGTTVPCSNGSE